MASPGKVWSGLTDDTDMYGLSASVKISTFTSVPIGSILEMSTYPIDQAVNVALDAH